jgi:hypothetical protein
MPRARVDAVVDDTHALRVQRRVAAQDVGAHALADGDDRGGALVGALLDPARHGVAAAELLGLPWAQRLEAVRRDDVRDAVQQRREMAREVGVPGVTVHHVGARDIRHDLEVDPERLEGRVGRGEFGRDVVGAGARLVAIGAEGPHAHVDEGAQRLDELGRVHAGASVDLGRILLRDDVDAHVSNASTPAGTRHSVVPCQQPPRSSESSSPAERASG